MAMTAKHEGSMPSDTPSDTMSTVIQRVPPPEKPEAIRTRSKVIAAFWAVIIFLGFPIWWQTTSIYRARLPVDEMIDWANGKVVLEYPSQGPSTDPRATDLSPRFPS